MDKKMEEAFEDGMDNLKSIKFAMIKKDLRIQQLEVRVAELENEKYCADCKEAL